MKKFFLLLYCLKEMDIFSVDEVEIFVIYMYFTVSLISKIMPFILQLQFPVPVT